MNSKTFVIGALLIGALTACNKDEALEHQPHDQNKMMTLMHQMMMRMDSVKVTNDPEVDFARMMIVHHQGAIEMSKLELREGKSDSMQQMARTIIEEQEMEIQELLNILAKLTVDNSDTSFTHEHHESMMKMDKTADIQHITGDTDNDFATLMIIHHQGAIDNASSYLHHGNHAQLKDMATHMVAMQTMEIQIMADWVNTHKR